MNINTDMLHSPRKAEKPSLNWYHIFLAKSMRLFSDHLRWYSFIDLDRNRM
ncbi:unknown [Bacteroides sp. CAG:545]|nr:unknown [Bacteroides sp. CAG:545]